MFLNVLWDVAIGGLRVPGEIYLGLFWIYVAITLISLLLYLLSWLPIARSLARTRLVFLSLLLGCVFTYIIPFILVIATPSWYDNEVEKTLEFPEHLFMALWAAPFFQLVIVPVVFGVMMILHSRRRRTG